MRRNSRPRRSRSDDRPRIRPARRSGYGRRGRPSSWRLARRSRMRWIEIIHDRVGCRRPHGWSCDGLFVSTDSEFCKAIRSHHIQSILRSYGIECPLSDAGHLRLGGVPSPFGSGRIDQSDNRRNGNGSMPPSGWRFLIHRFSTDVKSKLSRVMSRSNITGRVVISNSGTNLYNKIMIFDVYKNFTSSSGLTIDLIET